MHTVADLTRLFDLKSKTSIRAWAETFAEFLSEGANPERGQTRIFTEQDAATLHTVHTLKQKGMDASQIAAALSAGELYPLPAPETAQDGSGSADEVYGGTSALVIQLTGALGQFEAKAAALEAERDRLLKEKEAERGRVEELHKRISDLQFLHTDAIRGAEQAKAAAVLDAEKRASAAEARAHLLAAQLEEARNAAATPPTPLPSTGWLARLMGRK